MNFPQLCTPKRVLMSADTVGGVWTYALELIRALGEQDLEVILATMGAPLNREQRKDIRKLHHARVFESNYKLEWMDRPWVDLARAGEWLLDLEARLKPDIVHLNCYVPAALPFQSPKMVVGHSCVLSWWQAVRSEPAPSEWNWYRYRVTRGLRAADLVIAPSHAMLDALQRHYGPLAFAEVIPNGRDPQMFTPLHKEKFILIAGRLWDAAKNLDSVVQIAPELSWPVYAAGELKHPDGSTLQAPNVKSLGWLSSLALAPWFGRASIYVLPARYEPFGLSVLEAALSGCALVLGDIPSLRGLWEGAALFVPPDDRAALKSALCELTLNSPLREELGAHAQQRAMDFTPDRMALGYLSAYSDLMMTRIPKANALASHVL
jgi:glycosyltransferase involved in cell wall biosynthesis